LVIRSGLKTGVSGQLSELFWHLQPIRIQEFASLMRAQR